MAHKGRNLPSYDWGKWYTKGSAYDATTRQLMYEMERRNGAPRLRALDIGAGPLLSDSLYLRAQGFARVTAVDHWVGFGKEEVSGIECVKMPAERYVIEREAFDVIIAFNTFFYLRKSEIERIMRRAYAGLSSGGVFLFNVGGEAADYESDNDVTLYAQSEAQSLLKPYEPAAELASKLIQKRSAVGEVCLNTSYYGRISKA